MGDDIYLLYCLSIGIIVLAIAISIAKVSKKQSQKTYVPNLRKTNYDEKRVPRNHLPISRKESKLVKSKNSDDYQAAWLVPDALDFDSSNTNTHTTHTTHSTHTPSHGISHDAPSDSGSSGGCSSCGGGSCGGGGCG